MSIDNSVLAAHEVLMQFKAWPIPEIPQPLSVTANGVIEDMKHGKLSRQQPRVDHYATLCYSYILPILGACCAMMNNPPAVKWAGNLAESLVADYMQRSWIEGAKFERALGISPQDEVNPAIKRGMIEEVLLHCTIQVWTTEPMLSNREEVLASAIRDYYVNWKRDHIQCNAPVGCTEVHPCQHPTA